MSQRIYVGNLSWDLGEPQIRSLFAEYGTVTDCHLVEDRETGRSRGFAFVEMERADAAKAIAGLNGRDVDGRALTVNEARPREDRAGAGRRF